MEVTVTFESGERLDCRVGKHVMAVEPPESRGGSGNVPTPSDYLLVSLAGCGAYFVRAFCEQRDISLDGVAFSLDAHLNEQTKLYDRIEYKVRVTDDFPKKYHSALARSVEQCFVKKHFETPPAFSVSVE